MCFYWKNIESRDNGKELSIEEISKIAGNFRRLHALILSGGEPFLRDDLSEIISVFNKRSGTKHVSIPTNFFCDDTPEKIRDIIIKHPGIFFRILISLDGIDEDHDAIRGLKGGFQKLMSNYEKLHRFKKNFKNLSLNTVTVLTSYNAEKIPGILAFAGELDVDDIKLVYVRGDSREAKAKNVSPEKYLDYIKYAETLTIKKNRTKSFYNNLFSSVSLVAKEQIAEFLIKKQMALPCNAGSKLIVISETGKAIPCEILGQELGDLREHDYNMTSIMKSEKAQKVMQSIKEGRCCCAMDCNTISNVVCSPSMYPRVLKKLLAFYR